MKQTGMKRNTKKRNAKKQIAILLVCCMLFTLLPTTALASEPSTTVAKDITLGTSAIQEPTEVTNDSRKYYTPNSYIYFGKNGETDIKWRVLDADKANDGTTDGMFLLSEYVLATGISFNANSSKGNQYQGSDAQTWCKNFAENFSLVEQKAMFGVTKPDAEKKLYGIEWGSSSLTTADKLFFLSAEELATYVGNYDSAPGLAAKTDASKASAWWWLRSPYAFDTNGAGVVGSDGVVSRYSVVGNGGARPALNLNLSSVLFTSAAVGGKTTESVEADGTTGIFENKNYGDIEGNDGYKLTLLDESRSGFSAYLKSLSGNTATVSYSGATTGTNEHISVIIKNGNDVKYYGRVADVTEARYASGDVDITLPNGYNPADGDVLCVFNEQYNGDKMTDYASDLVVLPDYRWYTNDTTKSEFTISTVSELVGFANLVNGTNLPEGVSEHVAFENKTVKLANDIDLKSIANWTPIGIDGYFEGTFDGNNKTIFNLKVNSGKDYVGLFEGSRDATVKDLSVSGNVTGTRSSSHVGGIVGQQYGGSIKNCSFSGNVTGNGANVGGIVGYAKGTISKCRNYATVSGSARKLGGIVGYLNSADILYCYNQGSVTSESDDNPYVGGIAGEVSCDTSNVTMIFCYNTGNISATGTNATIGGTIGRFYSFGSTNTMTIDSCYFLDSVDIKGIGSTDVEGNATITGEAVPKSADAFASGEVAWLLQNAADDADGQVWGQTLTGSNKDNYPVFANESGSNKVYKVTFVIDEDTTNVKYVNGGTITVADPTAPNGYSFDGWYPAQTGGTEVTDITADTTLYARWEQLSASGDVTTGSGLVYNGQPQKLITTGSALNGNVVYSDTKDGDYFFSIPEKTDAGTYTVWYKIVGIGGYANTTPQSITVTIAKAEATYTKEPEAITGLKADGTKQELITAGSTTCGTLLYNVNGGEYEETIPTGTEAGDYTVGYYVEGDRNHNDSEPQSIKVTIAPKPVYYGGGGYYEPEQETAWENPFTDVHEGDWFYGAVKYAHQNKLFAGMSATEFAPNMPMSRGMLVTVLYRLAGSPAVAGAMPFADVNSDAYYRNAILWAVQNNVVSGIGDNLFAPDANITREQIAIILYRFAQYCGYDTTQGGMQIREYNDYDNISGYALNAMTWAVNSGLLKGKGENTCLM